MNALVMLPLRGLVPRKFFRICFLSVFSWCYAVFFNARVVGLYFVEPVLNNALFLFLIFMWVPLLLNVDQNSRSKRAITQTLIFFLGGFSLLAVMFGFGSVDVTRCNYENGIVSVSRMDAGAASSWGSFLIEQQTKPFLGLIWVHRLNLGKQEDEADFVTMKALAHDRMEFSFGYSDGRTENVIVKL